MLSSPAHGKIEYSDVYHRYFESTANYVCDDGYRVPAGQNGVRVCSHTGRWRGGTPLCQGEAPRQLRVASLGRRMHLFV